MHCNTVCRVIVRFGVVSSSTLITILRRHFLARWFPLRQRISVLVCLYFYYFYYLCTVCMITIHIRQFHSCRSWSSTSFWVDGLKQQQTTQEQKVCYGTKGMLWACNVMWFKPLHLTKSYSCSSQLRHSQVCCLSVDQMTDQMATC